jgi:hypothetical protein
VSTQAQVNANRANSQQSTGPKTDAGKARSSHNAVKSALTGQTILLPTDDVPAYERLVQSLIDLHTPATYREELLVQSIADIEWRLRRIPIIVSGLMGMGRREQETLVPYQEVAEKEAAVYLKYERSLKNLSIQETRLRRMRDNDLAELCQLQTERKEKVNEKNAKQPPAAAKTEPEKTVPRSAVDLFNEAKKAAAANPCIDISEIGFEFEPAPQAQKQAA